MIPRLSLEEDFPQLPSTNRVCPVIKRGGIAQRRALRARQKMHKESVRILHDPSLNPQIHPHSATKEGLSVLIDRAMREKKSSRSKPNHTRQNKYAHLEKKSNDPPLHGNQCTKPHAIPPRIQPNTFKKDDSLESHVGNCCVICVRNSFSPKEKSQQQSAIKSFIRHITVFDLFAFHITIEWELS